MALRLAVAICMLLVVPCLGRAQQRLGLPVAREYELYGWGGNLASPGMFGPRALGQSLTAGGRTFARGGTALLTPVPFAPVGTQTFEPFTAMRRTPGEFVGTDPTGFSTNLSVGGPSGRKAGTSRSRSRPDSE
jgi:hypothetical protein